MRTLIALLLTLPLFGCEPESVMERNGETPADAVENTADTIEDAKEDDGEEIETGRRLSAADAQAPERSGIGRWVR